jgi:PEGA domain
VRRLSIALLVGLARVAAASPSSDVLACPERSGDVKNEKNEKKGKSRAADHYRHGQDLYAGGEYEAAIPEFLSAYCLVPVPEALFNMAQAYERLVDYERAVMLFQAYVKALPASSKEEIATVEHRIAALRKLPARIRITTEPAGARLVLEGPIGTKLAMANAEPLRLPAGTYKLRVELPGYVPIEEEIVAEIGQPYTYSYRLAPQTGVLRVLTSPNDAHILVDDRAVGTGSYVDRLPVGQHTLSVEASDRPTERRTVEVGAEGEVRLFVAMKPARPPNGKIELLIGSAAFGLVEGGLLGTALSTSKPAAAVTSAVIGAAGFLVPYLVLPPEVPTGQTSLMVGGRLWGGLEAATLAATIFPGKAFEEHIDDTSFMIAGSSIAFGVGAGFLARNLDISAGDASLVNSGAIWGTTLGVLTFYSFASSESQAGGPIALLSLNAGLLIGAILANNTELSRGHVFLIDLGGFAGLVSGTALSALVEGTALSPLLGRTDVAARYALGGTVIGLAVGTFVTRDIDSDTRILPTPGFTTDAAGRAVPLFGFAGTW